MPMFLARRNPHYIARPDLAHGFALSLNPADAGDNEQRLAERMRMPIGPRARLEGDAIRNNSGRRRGGNDRILPDRAGEVFFGRPACRPRAGEMDIHGVPLLVTDAGLTGDYLLEAACRALVSSFIG